VIALHGQGTEGMSMDQHAGTTTRPTAVTVAAAIWLFESATALVSGSVTCLDLLRQPGGSAIAAVFGGVVLLASVGLRVWLALLMARGSGTARLWLAVFAVFAVIAASVRVSGGVGGDLAAWQLVVPATLVVASVLSYLPSVRPFFPAVERRPRTPEPRTIGWDPMTGERITEPTSTRAD
jgi:hypothetical protein